MELADDRPERKHHRSARRRPAPRHRALAPRCHPFPSSPKPGGRGTRSSPRRLCRRRRTCASEGGGLRARLSRQHSNVMWHAELALVAGVLADPRRRRGEGHSRAGNSPSRPDVHALLLRLGPPLPPPGTRNSRPRTALLRRSSAPNSSLSNPSSTNSTRAAPEFSRRRHRVRRGRGAPLPAHLTRDCPPPGATAPATNSSRDTRLRTSGLPGPDVWPVATDEVLVVLSGDHGRGGGPECRQRPDGTSGADATPATRPERLNRRRWNPWAAVNETIRFAPLVDEAPVAGHVGDGAGPGAQEGSDAMAGQAVSSVPGLVRARRG